MLFEKTMLSGVFIISLVPHIDERGFFARSFCKKEFEQRGLQGEFVQNNISFNRTRGTLRGLHYQEPPFEEVKLVSCRRGAIYDVIVDIRKKALSFGKWIGIELSAQNNRAVYIPAGFAHGFQTLSDNAEVSYLMGNYYHPEAARGIRFDDPLLNISWPHPTMIISEQDKKFPTLNLL